jgi:protein TonB
MMASMVVAWEGGTPPDKDAWIAVARGALNEDAAAFWLRFYKHPDGWRFDLECRHADEPTFDRADESVALQLYRLLAENGKPLDPDWRPLAASPPASIVPEPEPAAVAPPAEPAPAPDAAPALHPPEAPVQRDLPLGHRRGKKKRRHADRERAAEAKAPDLAAVEARTSVSEGVPEPQPVSPSGAWRRLVRPAVVYLPAVLLLAFAGWLSLDRSVPRTSSPGATLPSATASPESFAERRLRELEAIVARLTQERAQAPPSPAPAPRTSRSTPPRPSPRVSAPSPTPLIAPTAPVPADFALPSLLAATDAPEEGVTVPLGVAEPLSTPPPPVRAGELVDVNDPALTAPVALTRTAPRYPPLAMERRLTGTVRLRALVDETGAVVEVALVNATPRGQGFEDAAMRHARTRVYRPATKQGVPVRVWLPIVVEFRLPGQ